MDMSDYSEIVDERAYKAALALCRGSYQQNLLRRSEALSGSTLKGKAKRYGARYKASAASLIARCRAHGIRIGERRGEHGKRILVIG